MIYDSFFIKGQSHDICQDYALSGQIGDLTYAMVSDGCSMIATKEGALPHPLSDFASRLVCLSAERVLKHLAPREGRAEASATFFELLAASARSNQKILELGTEVADATLGLITLKNDVVFCISVGDSVIAVESEEAFDFYVTKFMPNYPPYVSYLISQNKLDEYKSLGISGIETYTRVSKTTCEILETETTEVSASVGTVDNLKVLLVEDDTKAIAVFSDGITDMVNEGQSRVETLVAIEHAMKIKNPCGQFVRRRLKAIARGQKTGIGPNDDLSMAMIRLDKNND